MQSQTPRQESASPTRVWASITPLIDGRVAPPSRFLRPRKAFPAAVRQKNPSSQLLAFDKRAASAAGESFVGAGLVYPEPRRAPPGRATTTLNRRSAFELPRASRAWIASNRLRGHSSYENAR